MRAFSLLEVMAVVAITGVIATLAVPNVVGLAEAYRAREAVRGAQFAIAEARNEAQRQNRAARVDVHADRIVVSVPDSVNEIGLLRQVITWRAQRTFRLDLRAERVTNGANVTALADGASAHFYFCATSEAAWVDVTLTPLCPLGDLASGGGPTVLTLARGRARAELELLPALASLRMR